MARADSIVARIDQYEIPAAEFQLFMGAHKAAVAKRLFPDRPVVTAAMWLAPRDGRTAAALLRDEALADALRTKARQIIFVERGLSRSAGYDAIRAEWQAENDRRARATAAGKAIYGPHRWTFEVFYRNRDAELTIRLRELLCGSTPSSPNFAELEHRIEDLVHDRLAHAHVVIDRAVEQSVPVP